MDAVNPFPAERTAVITGAASPRGIGRATADRLARDGWSVAILDLDYGTIGSVVIDVGHRVLWACCGTPCRGEWREVRV